jgi:hypothetical protein
MIRRKALHGSHSGQMEIKLQMNRNEIRIEEKIHTTRYEEQELSLVTQNWRKKKPIQYMGKRKDNVSKLQCRD